MNEFLKYCKDVCVRNPSLFEAVKLGYKACFEDDEVIPVDPSKMDSETSATASAQYADISNIKKQEEEVSSQIDDLNQQKTELDGELNTATQSIKTTMDAASAKAKEDEEKEDTSDTTGTTTDQTTV